MSVNRERAWKYLSDISFSRISGSEGERQGAEYFKKVCDELGVSAAIETYEIDNADIQEASLRLKSGDVITAYGVAYSGNTPAEGITAPFCYVNTADQDADLYDLKGKIALVAGGGTMPASLKKIKEKGAVAFIAIHGGFYDDERIANGPRIRTLPEAAKVDLPGVSIHMRDAKRLVCEHSGEALTLVIRQTSGRLTAYNVIAEIPGTGDTDEAVIFSAHSDTVIHALGSWDNGTGCVTLLEAMHHFKENPPKRTVRFLWCGSEEIGSYGSRSYMEEHKEDLEKTIYNINIDMIGAPLSRNLFCASAQESVMHYTDFYAKINGWPLKSYVDLYASDSSLFAVAGVPSCCFGQDMPRGGAEIHNYHDTLDQVDPQAFIDGISFIVGYGETIINAKVNPIPKGFCETVAKKIESWKPMMEAMPLLKKTEEKTESAEEGKE